jgi:hypothetical protein
VLSSRSFIASALAIALSAKPKLFQLAYLTAPPIPASHFREISLSSLGNWQVGREIRAENRQAV